MTSASSRAGGARRPFRVVASAVPIAVLSVTAVLVVPAVLIVAVPARGAVERQPTEQEVVGARQRAEQLRVAVSGQAADVASATAALAGAAAQSALVLEAYRSAAEAQRAAAVELTRRESELEASEASVAQARAEVVRWARTAYLDGGALGASPAVHMLFAGGATDAVVVTRTWLQRAGQGRVRALSALQAALDRQQRVMDVVRATAEAAEAATARADAARSARDAVLDAQRRRLADLRLLLAGTRRSAQVAGRRAADLTAARLSAGVFPGPGGNRVTGPVGDCAGGDVSAYGNGLIPLPALCPLSVPSGGRLRADAAYAFNRLSVAYARRFGRPPCVTDSYRSYDEQVQVRAARAAVAAVPGRSNHGWGTAVDLCGGIERFDTGQHRWMLLNAPLFGWFHPAWAASDGSMPEAWHWEFSG